MTFIENASETNGHVESMSWSDAPLEAWSDAAPGRLGKRYLRRGVEAGWREWQRWLAGRRRPRSLAAKTKCAASPLTWALPGDLVDSPVLVAIEQLWQIERGARRAKKQNRNAKSGGRKGKSGDRKKDVSDDHRIPGDFQSDKGPQALAEHIQEWRRGEPMPIRLAYALETLAWARALPKLAGAVDEAAWWGLWDRLVELARPGLASPPGNPLGPEQMLAGQLLAAELPLTLAYLFPELACAAELGSAGWQELRRGLEANVLGAGFLPSGLWESYRPLLACWTRALSIARMLGAGEATSRGAGNAAPSSSKPFEAPRQYERFLTSTLRLCRADGSQMLSSEVAAAWDKSLFAAARRLVKGSPAAKALRVARPDRPGQSKRTPGKRRVAAAAHSAKATAAILRPDWRRDAPRLAVAYHDDAVRLELIAGGETLLSGLWSFDVTLAGEPARLLSPWEEICWVSDSDVDYLELEAKLSGGLRVQRQILLAREDRFLLLADGVLSPQPGELGYSAELRQAPDVAFETAPETCEGRLVSGEKYFLVLPLALPEWRSIRRAGELAAANGRVALAQRSLGQGLFAPLFINLDPARSIQPFTWRRLTVAENLKALPDDQAVGYRVEIGKRQWLVYRSLGSKAPRSVLGQHLASEFMTGRFHRGGKVDRLVEVETRMTDPSPATRDLFFATIKRNLERVRERIAAAAKASSRNPSAVRLIAVTKYVDERITRTLAAAGASDLGESRPQQLWVKAAALADLAVEWHLIGHLQGNKIRRTLPHVGLIQSCDSPRLLTALEAGAAAIDRTVDVLLEVNISGEAAKHGFAKDEMPAALELAGGLARVRVRGLMGMGALEGGLAAAERDFAALARLRDDLRGAAPPGTTLDELSMGMSGDFEIAIRHGATMVRVGSALFAGLEGFDAD